MKTNTRIARRPRFVAIYEGGQLQAIERSTSLRGGLEEFLASRTDVTDPIFTGNMLSCLGGRGEFRTFIALEYEEES